MAAGYQRACSRVRDTPVACNSRREPALSRGRRPTPLARSVSSPGQGPEKAHRQRAHHAPITARISGYGRSSCEARPARSLWWSAYRCPVWSVATVTPCSLWGLTRASAGPVGLPPYAAATLCRVLQLEWALSLSRLLCWPLCGSWSSPGDAGRLRCVGALSASPGVLQGWWVGSWSSPGARERRSAGAGYVKV